MPVFEIGLDDGRKLRIEADDQEAALAGVAHFQGSSAAPEKEAPSALSDVAMQVPTGFNEGLANTVGAPVDAVSWAMRKAGLPIPDNAVGGSQSIKNALGYIKANPDNAPAQTTAGKFARSAGDMASQAILPEAAVAGMASRLSPRALNVAQQVVGDGSNVARTAATGAAAGVGAEAAGQATDGTALEPIGRIAGAVAGGSAAARLAALRGAAKTQALPTLDEVNAEKTRLYNDPTVKDLRIHPQAVNGLGNDIAQSLDQRGFFPEDHGPVFTAVNRLRNASGPVSVDELDAVRRSLNNHAGQLNEGRPTPTAAAASHAKSLLDDFVHSDMTDPANVLQGNGAAARDILLKARANAGAAIRSSNVSRLINNAETDAATANSGMNIQNRIRQTLKPLLKNNEAKMAGYTDEERNAVRKLVLGSGAMNALRHVGNAIGGSGISVLPGAFIGHAALGPAGAALPAAGWALKKVANAITQRQARNVASKLLESAPLAQPKVAANNAVKAANSAAARHLMLLSTLRGMMGGNNTGQ
jgi:hypothetical protein